MDGLPREVHYSRASHAASTWGSGQASRSHGLACGMR